MEYFFQCGEKKKKKKKIQKGKKRLEVQFHPLDVKGATKKQSNALPISQYKGKRESN